ncbi:MAG: L,D-transpeptidase [Pseudomonadota bacterium]
MHLSTHSVSLRSLCLSAIGTLYATTALAGTAKPATVAPALALSIDAVQATALTAPLTSKSKGSAALRVQILLDRAHFSPGEMDGALGLNSSKAVRGFQRRNNLPVSGVVDAATWAALNADQGPVLISYQVTAADVAGPYQAIPEGMMEKALLPALGYASVAEALGERFHIKPAVLQQLNPGKDLGKVDQTLMVPDVLTPSPLASAAKIVVDKSDSTVSILDEAGMTLAQFPASTGSRHDPLPLGQWKVNGVSREPKFSYNPKLFWDADESHSKATIPPGPNNPVGRVWVDLSKPHYGIHGTPLPANIGRTESHGCIRLTNWDAMTLAEAVRPGLPAVLQR